MKKKRSSKKTFSGFQLFCAFACGVALFGGVQLSVHFFQDHQKNGATIVSHEAKTVDAPKPELMSEGDIRGALEKQQGKPNFTSADFSPSGFNWTHYDFAKFVSMTIYERGYEGFIKERQVAAHQGALDSYISSLQKISRSEFNGWPKIHQKPFLINSLHAFQMRYLLKNGFNKVSNAAMQTPGTISLFERQYSFGDFIEREIFTRFRSRDVILSLHCFSKDCPSLRNSVYNFKNVDSRLHVSATRYIQNSNKVKFLVRESKVVLPNYLKKFKSDFPKNNKDWKKYLLEFFQDKSAEATFLRRGLFEVVYSK